MTIKKSLATPVAILFLGVFLCVVANRPAYAEYECKPDEQLWKDLGGAFAPLDVRKTAQNITASIGTDTTAVVSSGMNNTQEMACSKYVLGIMVNDMGLTRFKGMLDQIEAACPGLQPLPCQSISTTWGKISMDSNGKKFSYRDGRGAGSLLGFANVVQGATINEPIPTNLALFWNDSIKNVPFANTALAADVKYDSKGGFVEAILNVWKVFRNLAYGILSIVMLATGIMIMLRKKLPPQLTVTAQYALPRIVLAVVLITFSYPTVAVVAKGIWYIESLVISVIAAASGEDGINALFPVPYATLYLLFKTKGYMLLGSGFVTALYLGIFSAIAGVFWLLVWFRAMFLYIKIVISAVFAPIQFAMGAIPGNEKMTETWFKSMLSSAVSIVAMYAYANVVVLILLIIITNPAPVSGSGISPNLISVIFYPFFAIWGFYQAFKIPGVVSNAINGEQKPGGKR